MGFFSWLLGGNKKQVAAPVAEKKDEGGIAYDATLVAKLKEDHQQLLALFGKISQTEQGGFFDRLPALLHQFKLALQRIW